MKPYVVSHTDFHGRRHEHICFALNWFAAWSLAVAQYGMAAMVCVKPLRDTDEVLA